MAKKKEIPDTFFITFIGELVTVMTDIKSTSTENTEEGSIEVTSPFTFNAYLLDLDDNYMFFGNTPEQVTSVMPKSVLKFMSITENKDSFTEILDNMEDPQDEKEFN